MATIRGTADAISVSDHREFYQAAPGRAVLGVGGQTGTTRGHWRSKISGLSGQASPPQAWKVVDTRDGWRVRVVAGTDSLSLWPCFSLLAAWHQGKLLKLSEPHL